MGWKNGGLKEMGTYTQYVGDVQQEGAQVTSNCSEGAAEYELVKQSRKGQMFYKITKL